MCRADRNPAAHHEVVLPGLSSQARHWREGRGHGEGQEEVIFGRWEGYIYIPASVSWQTSCFDDLAILGYT